MSAGRRPDTVPEILERLYRVESGRILATLIRLLGDFDLAEEALQEAIARAIETWPERGVPQNPRAWLVATGRNYALDALRRSARWSARRRDLARVVDLAVTGGEAEKGIEDDRLRLIFTCCHPALSSEVRVALTLHAVCGLKTEEVARAFLIPLATLAQRLVRAKAKIRRAGIPFRIPQGNELRERLRDVLSVIYLVFAEGYAATSGDALVRQDLCQEAIRLARLVVTLAPVPSDADWREAKALLALLLLHDSRRNARQAADGRLLLLEDQDRSLWDRESITEGRALVEEVLREGSAGPYALEAAIAALHAAAESPTATDWRQIAAIYGFFVSRYPSPIVELNHGVAVGMNEGPARGLFLLDTLEARGVLRGHHLLASARADFLRRLGRTREAGEAYRHALRLTRLEPERAFLWARLSELGGT